jgi:GNAT superfamily N-acetyltransferase
LGDAWSRRLHESWDTGSTNNGDEGHRLHAMTGPASSNGADAAMNAYYETRARMTEYMPGAYAREGAAGTGLWVSTIPAPEFNVVSVGHRRDLREAEAFAREISGTGLPWSFQVRGDAGPDLNTLAARYGKTGTSTQPLLRWDAGSLPARPAALPAGAAVRKVSGKDSGVFAAALAAGFEVPEDVAGLLAQPDLLDAPGITGFLLELHGEAVATGLNVLAGQYAGMYSGSVPPVHRGNGYYRALVAARLADAVARGARHAVATNTPMSRPLFESVGFGLVLTWTYLTPAPARGHD